MYDEIIDFHVHPFYEEKNNFCFYDNILSSWQEFGEDMERAGITKFCGSVIRRFVPTDFSQIAELNEEAEKLYELFEGRYIPGIHIHSEYIEQSVAEIKKYSAKGFKLLGELCPYLMNWQDLCDENMEAVYDAADKCSMVVSFHSFVKGELDQSIIKAVQRFPNLIFVAAHPHEKRLLEEHIDRIRKYDNYYLDLSGTGIARYGTIKRIIEKVGSEKILFGSDYPINNPKMYIEAIIYEKIKDSDRENIFYKNAARILNLYTS